jgi:transcriptional regulator with XRE-family HTH domain
MLFFMFSELLNICMTTHSNLRQLRNFLGKTQTEIAALAGCSRHLIAMIETNRMALSERIASKISESTGVDATWLMNNDPHAEMINSAGARYSEQDQQQAAQSSGLHSLPHYRFRELQLAMTYDLLSRLLAASRLKRTMPVFMNRLEVFIKAELAQHPSLEDAVYGERRRASEAALKSGKVIALSLLTPFDEQPLRRGRARIERAIAAFTARGSGKKRTKSELKRD